MQISFQHVFSLLLSGSLGFRGTCFVCLSLFGVLWCSLIIVGTFGRRFCWFYLNSLIENITFVTDRQRRHHRRQNEDELTLDGLLHRLQW